MIPQNIVHYLETHGVPYERLLHRRAVTAQELAATVHMPGRQVAKAVMVQAGEKTFIAVLPATELLDEDRLAALLGVPSVRMLHEPEFEGLFPGCEAGAEPPFGGLFGLPVVIDAVLSRSDHIVFRAGSHEEAILMRFDDFVQLENHPLVGSFGESPEVVAWTQGRTERIVPPPSAT